MPEATAVVHVEADYNEEKIEDAKVEEIVDANIDGNTAEFKAESFSIYVFVTCPKLIVNLYNGESDEPITINVKSKSELEETEDHASIVYDPGVRALEK